MRPVSVLRPFFQQNLPFFPLHKRRRPFPHYCCKDFSAKERSTMDVKRGEVFYADLSPVVGSEQGGIRPVLIVQNDIGNRHSPTVIAAAITSKHDKTNLPTHIALKSGQCGLTRDSVILLEQVRTLDKRRLRECTGRIEPELQRQVDTALQVSFGLPTS
jgi:mRNA interferase MazF